MSGFQLTPATLNETPEQANEWFYEINRKEHNLANLPEPNAVPKYMTLFQRQG